MKTLSLILFAALLVIQIIAPRTAPAFDIVGPLTTTAFGCLYSAGYPDAIVRAYSLDNGGSVDPNAVQTLQNAQNANMATNIYMAICPNGDATSQVNAVYKSIPSTLYGMIWIKVIPNTTPGC